MKKIFKNPIFMFILGIVLTSGIAVTASQLFATSVKYEPSWTKSNGDSITNVSEAIDDVYRSFSQKDTILLENDLPDAFNV